MLSDRCAPLRMAGKICRLLSFEVVFPENCQHPSGVMEKKAHTKKKLSAPKNSEILFGKENISKNNKWFLTDL